MVVLLVRSLAHERTGEAEAPPGQGTLRYGRSGDFNGRALSSNDAGPEKRGVPDNLDVMI